jgi:hypothetical protein
MLWWLQVQVWWPPTRNPKRTGFSGAWWPAAVRKVTEAEYTVEYDNGETEVVNAEHIFPYDLPVGFGQEEEPLQVSCRDVQPSMVSPAACSASGALANGTADINKPQLHTPQRSECLLSPNGEVCALTCWAPAASSCCHHAASELHACTAGWRVRGGVQR